MAVRRTKLDNGLIIVSEQIEWTNSFALGFFIKSGSKDDITSHFGAAHLLEHLAFRRTKTKNSKQIANAFENAGAYVNAHTTKEMTCFYTRGINKNFRQIFDYLSDIVINIAIKEDELLKEISIISEEIKSYEDDPEETISDTLEELLLAGTPYAHPILGTIDTINRIKSSDILNFHKRFYLSNNIIISVVGNIEHQVIVDISTSFFCSNNMPSEIEFPTSIDTGLENIISFSPDIQTLSKGYSQTHINFGTLITGVDNVDKYKIALSNVIFGDGLSSRLYQIVREKLGIAYSIFSAVQNNYLYGIWTIYAATDKEHLERLIDIILLEMNKIRTTSLPTPIQLRRAKEQLITATIIENEGVSSRMENLVRMELLGSIDEKIDDIVKRIETVDLDNINDTIESYFCYDRWAKIVFTN